MFSLCKTVFFWAADSASILLDLANAGRDSGNAVATAIAAALALIRLAALLLFLLPALAWLYKQLFRKVRREEGGLRGVLIALLIASVLFEIWVTPTRLTDADEGSADAAITEQAEGADGT